MRRRRDSNREEEINNKLELGSVLDMFFCHRAMESELPSIPGIQPGATSILQFRGCRICMLEAGTKPLHGPYGLQRRGLTH